MVSFKVTWLFDYFGVLAWYWTDLNYLFFYLKYLFIAGASRASTLGLTKGFTLGTYQGAFSTPWEPLLWNTFCTLAKSWPANVFSNSFKTSSSKKGWVTPYPCMKSQLKKNKHTFWVWLCKSDSVKIMNRISLLIDDYFSYFHENFYRKKFRSRAARWNYKTIKYFKYEGCFGFHRAMNAKESRLCARPWPTQWVVLTAFQK